MKSLMTMEQVNVMKKNWEWNIVFVVLLFVETKSLVLIICFPLWLNGTFRFFVSFFFVSFFLDPLIWCSVPFFVFFRVLLVLFVSLFLTSFLFVLFWSCFGSLFLFSFSILFFFFFNSHFFSSFFFRTFSFRFSFIVFSFFCFFSLFFFVSFSYFSLAMVLIFNLIFWKDNTNLAWI